jgi:CHASE1-domain containing sensor protein
MPAEPREPPADVRVELARPGLRGTWRSKVDLRSQLATALLFALGVGMSTLFSVVLQVRNEEQQRADFAHRANQVSADLRAKLELPLEVLRSIAAFFAASQTVSRAEFAEFVAGALEQHPGLRALEWIPIVAGEQRAEYEARARNEGFQAFEFKQEAPNLVLVRADPRPEHFPIYYMEPADPRALGFDVGSSARRRAPMDLARQTGKVIASERLRLVEDPPSVHAIAVYQPVRTRRQGGGMEVRGFATEVFRVETLVRPVVAPRLEQGNGVVLLDATGPVDAELLFESIPGLYAESKTTARVTHVTRFPFAGRTWSMTLVAGHAQQAKIDAWPWPSFAAGVVMSALAAILLSAASQIYRLRREVHAALRFGQYTLVEKLGEGGMGVVYRARHALLRRPTAIKLLLPEKKSAEDIERFEREVQLTSQLSHPNTIAVYDYGRTPEGIFYYVMEFLDGIALEDLVANDGPLPAQRVVNILTQVCGALEEAHARGIVHRDVKPANLMLMDRGGIPDFVKVLDFGLLKENVREGSPALSRGTPLLGTPLYISPEAILTGIVDSRADLYSLGAVAYFLLTGRTVFEGQNLVDVCAQHLTRPPIPPSQRTSATVPASLEALLLRCLEKKPDDRPPTAAALLSELRLIEAEIGSFGEELARRWWRERGQALAEDLRAKRRVRLPRDDGLRLTVVVEPRPSSHTPG